MARQEGNREIKNLLAVLTAGVFGAAFLTYLFIAYYGPSGRYVAGYTLLDPSILGQVDVHERDPYTGQKIHFVFDQFVFAFFDSLTQQVRKMQVSPGAYGKFYTSIASELSEDEGDGKLERIFLQSHPALLTARIRVGNGSYPSKSKIFQTVEFIPQDYFRVQLLQGGQEGGWAYFYRQNSFKEAVHSFSEPVQ